MWGWIGRATNDPKNGSVTKVERIVNGVTETYTKKEDMEACISSHGSISTRSQCQDKQVQPSMEARVFI